MKSLLRVTSVAALLSLGVVGAAEAQALATFAILAGQTVTNVGSSTINGNIGVSPGGAVTGFPPGSVTAPYTIHGADAVANNAQNQLTSAYNILAGRPSTADMTGQDLGGLTLTAGVYSFTNSAQLTGVLTLDAANNPDAIFIFNVASSFDTSSGSAILLINGANANNVFFRVGASATLGSGTAFQGKILALSSISLNSTATINCGAALARNGSVTLISNVIGICPLAAGSIGTGTTGGENGTAVGDAINAYIAAGGVLPLGFGALAVLTPAELAEALAELAGQTAGGSDYTTGQGMDSFLEQLTGPHGPTEGGPPEESPGQGTVSVMGYADAAPVPGEAAFNDFDANRPVGDVAHWKIWSGTYGNYSLVRGDAAAGTVERTSAAYGLTFGFERVVTADSLIGFAISGGGTNFNLDDSLGSGHSAMMQAAIYGKAQSEQGYVSGAIAYGLHDSHTDRYVRFAGLDHYTAQFWTQDVAGQIEAGYHLGWLTPYAGLRVNYVATPGYSETTAGGTSTYALDYAAHSVVTARTEIGARAETTAELESATLRMHARAAWAHTFSTDTSVTETFQVLPGAPFKVKGATPAADALLIGLGTDLELQTGLVLGVSLDSSLSGSAQSYSGNAHLAYRW